MSIKIKYKGMVILCETPEEAEAVRKKIEDADAVKATDFLNDNFTLPKEPPRRGARSYVAWTRREIRYVFEHQDDKLEDILNASELVRHSRLAIKTLLTNMKLDPDKLSKKTQQTIEDLKEEKKGHYRMGNSPNEDEEIDDEEGGEEKSILTKVMESRDNGEDTEALK